MLVGAPGARADAPRLALDRNGRLHLVYLEQRGQSSAAIRYARSSSDLAFGPPRGLRCTVDGGAGFTRPAAVPYGANGGERSGSQQGLPGKKLAAGGDRVALVDSSLAPGRASRIWLLRRRLAPD